MDRIDQLPKQPTPVLPEPAYARQIIDRLADRLALTAPHNPASTPGLHRAFTVTVAEQVTALGLPDPVANEVTERVSRLLPPLASDTTVGAYTGLLRTLARTV